MPEQELGYRPVYTNFVTGYDKHKTQDGFVYDSAYYKRYYSSIDAELYFGNEYVDELVSVNWIIDQKQEPLFGYNSYVYDEVATGARLIRGSLAINFTSPNYLNKLLAAAAKESIDAMSSYTVQKTKEELTITEKKSTNTVTEFSDRGILWPETFDIDIIFGEKTSLGGDPVHIIIQGVRLTNCSSQTNASGEPVIEAYNFIAKDIKIVD